MSREYKFLQQDEDGRTTSETVLVCLDDEGAVLLAERLALAGAIEVWDHDRLVAVAPATAPAPSVAASEPPDPPESPPPRRKRFWAGAWRRGAEQA
jgi:hypothetical protein